MPPKVSPVDFSREAQTPEVSVPGRQTLDLRSETHFCLRQRATQKPPSLGLVGTLSRPPAPAFPIVPWLLQSSPSILPGMVLAPLKRYAPQLPQPSPRRPRPSWPRSSPPLAGSHGKLAFPAAGLAEKAVRVVSAVWRRKCGLIIDLRLLSSNATSDPAGLKRKCSRADFCGGSHLLRCPAPPFKLRRNMP